MGTRERYGGDSGERGGISQPRKSWSLVQDLATIVVIIIVLFVVVNMHLRAAIALQTSHPASMFMDDFAGQGNELLDHVFDVERLGI